MSTNASVEAFFSALKHSGKPQVKALRQLVRESVPGISERIKWNAPSFGMGDQDRITMRLQPDDRLQLILHRGAKVQDADGFTFEDPAGLVEWVAADRGVITLNPERPLGDTAALADVLRRWIAATR